MKLVVEIGASSLNITAFGKAGQKEGKVVVLKHEAALDKNKNLFESLALKGLDTKSVSAVAIILLFGPEKTKNPELLKESIIEKLEPLADKYPSYIPFAAAVLKKLLKEKNKIPVYVYSDTSFFAGLPEEELYYAIPKSSSEKSQLKKSGYHGIYHEYAAGLAGKNKKVISVVLDKKTTVCGAANSTPVTVSLGSTPLEGVMSLTSSGDLDPGAVFYIMKKAGYSIYKMDEILKKESGFLGVTGYRMEMAELAKLAGKDEKVKLAFNIYKNQILKYIGGALAILPGADALVFSGAEVNSLEGLIYDLLKQMNFLGIHLEELPWKNSAALTEVSRTDSKVKVFVNNKRMTDIVFEEMPAGK